MGYGTAIFLLIAGLYLIAIGVLMCVMEGTGKLSHPAIPYTFGGVAIGVGIIAIIYMMRKRKQEGIEEAQGGGRG